jgi:hypothetical protein
MPINLASEIACHVNDALRRALAERKDRGSQQPHEIFRSAREARLHKGGRNTCLCNDSSSARLAPLDDPPRKGGAGGSHFSRDCCVFADSIQEYPFVPR